MAKRQKKELASRDEEIRKRAYELYLERGGENGDEVADWLRAESEQRERSRTRSDGEPQDRL